MTWGMQANMRPQVEVAAVRQLGEGSYMLTRA